jgi:hypothetical protein
MKMKYTEKPTYPEVEIVGKTIDSLKGTIDSRPIGRRLLTEEPGFGKGTQNEGKIVLDGDGVTIKSVKKVPEVEVVIELVDGQKSAASFKFFDAFEAENDENGDVTDLFTTNGEQISRLEACAERMCDANPGVDGQYKIIEKAGGKRVFLRLIAKSLTETGKVDD